jgi:hypothetical protein
MTAFLEMRSRWWRTSCELANEGKASNDPGGQRRGSPAHQASQLGIFATRYDEQTRAVGQAQRRYVPDVETRLLVIAASLALPEILPVLKGTADSTSIRS